MMSSGMADVVIRQGRVVVGNGEPSFVGDVAITDGKSLHGALEKNVSLGFGLSEKRTPIEVAATRHQTQATGVRVRRVNSDRELADVFTNPSAST